MTVKLFTAGSVLICAGLLYGQADQKKTEPQQQPAVSAPEQEAARQGRVALKPNAQESPSESLQQAIAFERYKDLAAQREAAKEAGASVTTTKKHTVAMAKGKK